MGVKITGADGVRALLLRVNEDGPRRVLRDIMLRAEQVQKLAIAMAPVDKGNLEAAIKIDKKGGDGPVRDALGRFMRKEIEVYVDFAEPAGDGRFVGDYAYEIHEHQVPKGGEFGLGPRSFAKQMANPGIEVGGGFMDRAAEEVEKGLDAELKRILDSLF